MLNNRYKKKIICIIQARMGSRRLPGKSLKLLLGVPILGHILKNTEGSKYINKFIVATSNNSNNDCIESYCKSLNVDCFRGEENNVLSRFVKISENLKPDLIMRLTGDNPFVEASLIDHIIGCFLKKYPTFDYINNIDKSGYPYGLSAELFTYNILKLLEEKTDYSDLEHVTAYIRGNKKLFKTAVVKTRRKFRYTSLTVDSLQDFKKAEKLMKELQDKNNKYSYLNLLKK